MLLYALFLLAYFVDADVAPPAVNNAGELYVCLLTRLTFPLGVDKVTQELRLQPFDFGEHSSESCSSITVGEYLDNVWTDDQSAFCEVVSEAVDSLILLVENRFDELTVAQQELGIIFQLAMMFDMIFQEEIDGAQSGRRLLTDVVVPQEEIGQGSTGRRLLSSGPFGPVVPVYIGRRSSLPAPRVAWRPELEVTCWSFQWVCNALDRMPGVPGFLRSRPRVYGGRPPASKWMCWKCGKNSVTSFMGGAGGGAMVGDAAYNAWCHYDPRGCRRTLEEGHTITIDTITVDQVGILCQYGLISDVCDVGMSSLLQIMNSPECGNADSGIGSCTFDFNALSNLIQENLNSVEVLASATAKTNLQTYSMLGAETRILCAFAVFGIFSCIYHTLSKVCANSKYHTIDEDTDV